MAIALDATSSGRNSSGTITVSHTVGAGSDRVLYVLTSVQDSNHANFPVTGITFGGVALTKVRSDEAVGNNRTEIWRLIAPATSTANIVCTVTGAVGEFALIGISLTGVDQTTPTDAENGTSGNSSAPSVAVVSVTDNAWFLTVASAETTFSSNGTGQTTIATLTDQSYENARGTYEGPKVSAGSDTQSFVIASGQTWAISSVAVRPVSGDVTNPTVSTLSPADNATGVAINSNLVITFDEEVDVETGNITIKKTSDNSTVETINVAGAQVTGTGTTTITINPSDLANSVEYYVLIDATCFDDPSGNSYAGISSTTAWSFTTIAAAEAAAGTTVSNRRREKSYIFICDTDGGDSRGAHTNWDFDSITRQINGSGEVNISTDKTIDTYTESDVNVNNAITIRVASDKLGSQGLDYFSGYIARKSLLSDGNREQLQLRVFSHVAKLYRALWRASTTIVHDFTAGSTVTTIVQQIIDNYRTLDTNARVNYTSTSVENTGTTIKDKYEGVTFGEGLSRAIQLAYTSGRIWYWRVLGDDVFTLQRASVGADHSFIYGKHISSLTLSQDLINSANEAFVYYNNATVTRYANADNITSYGYLSEFTRETNVTDATTASSIGNAIIEGKTPPILKIQITINDTYEDAIEMINPGDTCELLNTPAEISDLLTGNMLITKTTYRKDEVDLELEIKQPLMQSSLDNLRRNFDESRKEGLPTTYS